MQYFNYGSYINISAQHASRMDVLYRILRSNAPGTSVNSQLTLPGRMKVSHLVLHHRLNMGFGKRFREIP